MRLNTLLIIASILIIWLWALFAYGSTFSFENRGDANIVGTLWWIDHGDPDIKGPFPVMCSDLEPGGDFAGNYNYDGNRYVVNFYNRDVNLLQHIYTDDSEERVILVWDGERIIIE